MKTMSKDENNVYLKMAYYVKINWYVVEENNI